jgi:hypothetical protein
MIPIFEALELTAFDPVNTSQHMECITATVDLFHGTMKLSGAVNFEVDVEQLATSLIMAMVKREFRHHLPRQIRAAITQLSKKLESIGY